LLRLEKIHRNSRWHKILQKNKREECNYLNSRKKKKKKIKLSNKKNYVEVEVKFQIMIKNKKLLKRDFKIQWPEENLTMAI